MSTKKLYPGPVKEINTNTPEFPEEIISMDPGFVPGFFFGLLTVILFMSILILAANNLDNIGNEYKNIFCFNLKK